MIDERFKFLIVGGFNTALTFVIYAAFISAGMSYQLSLALVYIIGIVIGFALNREWTFAYLKTENSTRKSAQFLKYLILYIIVFTTNLLILTLLVEQLALNPIVAQLFALCVTTVLSFVLQKVWVFKN